MLGVLPPEVVLAILTHLPLRQLQRLTIVSKSWNTFIHLNESSIYHAAAILHDFVPANVLLSDVTVSDVPLITESNNWKDLCIKFYRMERRWEGNGRANYTLVAAPGPTVWRFKIDGEQRTVITTHLIGGLTVSAIDEDTILWLLPHAVVHPYAHCEYSDGFLVFTREGNTLEVWRRTRDARTSSRPPTAVPDSSQTRAHGFAWQSSLSASQDDRGAFTPWTAISPPNPVRALRVVHSTLLVASESAQEAYLFDLPTGRLMQTISFRESSDHPVQVNYVELGTRHIFLCTRCNVLVLPLDASDSKTSLKFPGQVEGFHEFYETQAFRVDYGARALAYWNTSRRTLVECSLEQSVQLSLPVLRRNFQAVHVSPCGSHFVTVDETGCICIVRDFEKALRDGVSLLENITMFDMRSSIMNLAFEDNKRIVVFVRYQGVFVIPFLLENNVSVDTLTMQPEGHSRVLRQVDNLDDIGSCSCLQLTRFELWYVCRKPRAQPALVELYKIDFSKPRERHIGAAADPATSQNFQLSQYCHMLAQTGEIGNTWQRLGHGVHSVVWRTRKSSNSSPGSSSHRAVAEVQSGPLGDLSNWVAVKVVYDNKSMPPHDIVREASILKSLSYTNIISMLDFVRGGPNAPYALYMPLIPLPLTVLLSSPLFSPYPITGPYSAFARPVLKPQQRAGVTSPFVIVAKSLIYQLLLAISFLHSRDPPISHRDINPGNVLIDEDGIVKLVDFGIAWPEPENGQVALSNSTTSATERPSTSIYKEWRETPEEMCCQVATGPHRAPELLFSPPIYAAMAVDLWSLGTTIAQFFTPLQLNPSRTPLSSPTSTTAEEVDEIITSSPFVIPDFLRQNIDSRATWERKTLFDGERGELGLAWSIFRLRGTPNEKTWPSFSSLPDVSNIEFREAIAQPLHTALPHLPTSSELSEDESPGSLIEGFLAYPPQSRLAAAQALQHPWFSADLLLPTSHPGLDETVHETIHEKGRPWLKMWEGNTLAGWLEPALVREGSKVTQT